MEPEDCTIRYVNEPTYTNIISQKLSKIRNKVNVSENVENVNTNPFDTIDASNDNNVSTNPFDGNNNNKSSINPFTNDNMLDTNPFNQSTAQKSTNPFADDLP